VDWAKAAVGHTRRDGQRSGREATRAGSARDRREQALDEVISPTIVPFVDVRTSTEHFKAGRRTVDRGGRVKR
jgi:hypothetical protein